MTLYCAQFVLFFMIQQRKLNFVLEILFCQEENNSVSYIDGESDNFVLLFVLTYIVFKFFSLFYLTSFAVVPIVCFLFFLYL